MQYYDFEVLKGDETISTERWVSLPDLREAWPKIAEIAEKIDAPGYRIRVNDEWGATVILIGVAAARIWVSTPHKDPSPQLQCPGSIGSRPLTRNEVLLC